MARVFSGEAPMATAFSRRSPLTVTRKSASRKTVRVCIAEIGSPILLMSEPMLMATTGTERALPILRAA